MVLAKKEEKLFTYADYLNWNDGRWEIIEGVVYDMSPAPNTVHQEISTKLVASLFNYFKNKDCKVFAAPFDVRFSDMEKPANHKDYNTVVQPDISVVCDKSKLDEKGCKGAPDLVIEILSPSTTVKDFNKKFHLYEKHGVQEYWIISPIEKNVIVYKLINGKYTSDIVLEEKDSLSFKGIEIRLSDLFE